jgi:hypothetical protein
VIVMLLSTHRDPFYPSIHSFIAGLIRRFKHVMEDRLTNPEVYHQHKDRYFQRAWSGEQFRNLQWADQHGDGKNYSWQWVNIWWWWW